MSSDNGIYILETKGPEFRVKHLQAIENYMYDNKTGKETNDMKVQIQNARKIWNDCKVFSNKKDALKYADKLREDYSFLEYGICLIKINEVF